MTINGTLRTQVTTFDQLVADCASIADENTPITDRIFILSVESANEYHKLLKNIRPSVIGELDNKYRPLTKYGQVFVPQIGNLKIQTI